MLTLDDEQWRGLIHQEVKVSLEVALVLAYVLYLEHLGWAFTPLNGGRLSSYIWIYEFVFPPPLFWI